MAILTEIDGMTGLASARVGTRLNRVKVPKIPPMHPFLNRITAGVTIQTKLLIAVTLFAGRRFFLGIDLMLGTPPHLVALRLWEATGMTHIAILSSRQRTIGIFMTQVAPKTIDLFSIAIRFRIGMTGLTGHRCGLEQGRVHVMVVEVEGMDLLLALAKGRPHPQGQQDQSRHHHNPPL